MKRKHSRTRIRSRTNVIASLLVTGLTITSIFPTTVYAVEVGEQLNETTNQVTSVLNDNRDLIEQAVIEAIQARGGDINDQFLVDQVREEVRKKIESGELKLDEKTEEETTETTTGSSETSTEDANTSSESVSVTDHISADEVLSDGDNSSKVAATRLIVTSDVELTEFYGAVTVDHYDNIYVLVYKSVEETDSAYNSFVANGIAVEKDASMDAIKEGEVPEDKVAKEVTDTEVTDVKEDTSSEAQPVAETVEEHKTIVAVIDTGISDVTNDDTFKDRIIEGTSTISDSYVDDNGHGTAMAKIIAEDTVDENVMILPIKALDKDGKGTVLSVALAIKYAKEHGADVISLSLSGIGQSNVLTNAINDCYNNGITVVTAAGNDNADSMNYMPGNVDAAINIAAAEYDANGKIVAAGYTNHGDNVDFAALGTYQLSVSKNNTTIDTQLVGTSVAAAHVSAYVALIKQINSTVDGIVTEISENDVLESLKASAQNVEGVSRTYFGYGFLTKDNLVFKSSTTGDDTKDSDLEEKEEDFTQNVHAAGYIGYIWGVNVWQAWDYNSFLEAWGEIHIYYGGVGHIQLTGNVWKKDLWSVGNGVNISVDLNGYTMYANPNLYYDIALNEMFMIENGGTLKFYDGNIDGRGLCYWPGNGSDGAGGAGALMSIWPGGTLILESCQIGNVTNLDDYNQESADAGGTIVNNCGTLTATNTNFHDCSGTAIWGVHPSNSIYGNGARTVLTDCSSNNVSGLWSDGTARGISASIKVNGGTYKVGRNGHYLAGIEANNNSTLDIQNITLGGCVTVQGGSTATVRNCTISNDYVSSTDKDLWYAIGTTSTKPIYVYDSTVKGALLGCILNGTAGGAANVISGCNIYENHQTGISKEVDCVVNVINCNLYKNTTGIGSKNGGTVNLSKCNIYSNSSYGIENNGGTSIVIADTNIYSNKYGISNYGNLSLTGGYVYNNSDTGVMCMGGTNTLNSTIENNQITGVYVAPNQTATNYGTIRSNDYYGVFVSSGATYNHEAGSIHNNNQKRSWYEGGAGIRNLGTTNLKGGYVDSNYWANVWNQGTLSVTGTHLLNCQGGTGGTPGNPDYYYNSFQPAYGIVNDNYGTTTINGNIGISGNSTTGVWANSGTVNFHKGTVSDNTGKGFEVLNAGNNIYATLNMYGGTVRDNGINIYNTGTSNISGGEIKKSTQMNVDVAAGTVNFKGGSITESGENHYGVQIENNGTSIFNLYANIGSNYAGGVRNIAVGAGHYNVYKGATTAVGSNGSDIGVYLKSGASISIHDNLTSDVKVASDDRYTGKVIANCDNEAIANTAAAHLKLTGNTSFQKTTLNTKKYADTYTDLRNAFGYNHEALWNHYNQDGRNEGRIAEDCGKTVAYRKGNGNNGAKTQIIVSQLETVTLDSNASSMKIPSCYPRDYVTAKVKTTKGSNTEYNEVKSVDTYWGEPVVEAVDPIAYHNNEVAPFVEKLGWGTSKTGSAPYSTTLSNYAAWYKETLYAQWNPIFFNLKSDNNSPSDSTATGGWGTVTSHTGNDAYMTIKPASCKGYSFLGWYTKPNGGEQIYDRYGNIIAGTSMSDNNNKHLYGGKNDGTVTLYAHWATFDIQKVNAKIGTQTIPLGNGDQTVIATYARQNIYTDSKNSPYGSDVYLKTTTRAINGDKAPNINKIWVKVYNTVDANQYKEYVLYSNQTGTNEYNDETLLDTVKDLSGAMDLTYEIHITNTYGLEKIAETYTSRDIELFTTIEKLDTDINNSSDSGFSAGTRGVLHVYTTGWVDNFNFTFPDVMYKSWEYDKQLGYPTLTPSANDVFAFTYDDPKTSKYAISSYPSEVRTATELEGYKTYGDTGFIKCYDFYFWIPMTISNPNNPDYQKVDSNTVWKVTTTARKFYDRKPIYENNKYTGSVYGNVVTSTSSAVGFGGDPVKVTDQFRTVIKKVD